MICFVYPDACTNFCENQGGCEIVNEIANCTCPPGFIGDKCQLNGKMKIFSVFCAKISEQFCQTIVIYF